MARDTKKIDARGRFFIPSKLKDKLGSEFVATTGLDDGILSIYTAENFELIKAQLKKKNSLDAGVRLLQRAIIGFALEVTLDAQGRITLNSELWDLIGAKPGDEICVTDFLDKIEISKKDSGNEKPFDLSELRKVAESYYVEGL